jgi:hypothetical protein
MFANIRSQFALKRAIAKCEKYAHNDIVGSMGIIAAVLELEAKNILPENYKQPIYKLCDKHTEIVRNWVVTEGNPAITFYKAQLDSVLVQAINSNELERAEIDDVTVENILKKLINLKLVPARFMDLDDSVLY